MKKVLVSSVTGLGLFLSLSTLFSLFGGFYWVLDVFSHYHLQYTIGLTLILAVLVLMRRGAASLVIMLVALLVNLYLVLPFFWPPAVRASRAADEPALRVMAMNISTSNAGYSQVIELIRERQPDLVFMSEVRDDLVARLETELADSYPYLHAVPSRMTLGIAFLSRHPFVSVETMTVGGEERGRRRYLRAEIEWHGQKVLVAGIHPLPPFNANWAQGRNTEIALMGQLSQEATEPFILLGDLNASPWSHPMRRLMGDADLRYALKGHGVWPTWRLAGPLLGAPLDYILVSPEWQVVDYLEAGDIRSDHIPIQADLRLSSQ